MANLTSYGDPQQCANCRFSVLDPDMHRRCHRPQPLITERHYDYGDKSWPPCADTAWCGEWEEDGAELWDGDLPSVDGFYWTCDTALTPNKQAVRRLLGVWYRTALLTAYVPSVDAQWIALRTPDDPV